ncbi:uncharacterized protein LOC124805833 isoform X2 [Hydra vulgaris]|uniref:uncharacterized protein LOC124805833 isoform X2 n=1 Tax=Hydra vulgaris TaxID=6087 RepID=UPI001F5FC5E9|nr:uncharacterized protein LOC124805833 isoform X2 [Hydra vulgaris]
MEANLEVMISNLNKCSEGIKAIIETTEIMESEFLVCKSPLFKTEDNFLSLASSGSSDCLFYCVLFSLPSAEGAIYIARYFEFDSLSGCYQNLIHSKLKEKFGINSVLPYQVYTSQDVESYSKRQDSLYQKQKPHGKAYGYRKRPFNKISIETLSTSINSNSVEELSLSTDKLPFLQNTSSVQLNLFQYYCGQLFNHGVLKWRYMNEAMHIVLMNDYDSNTGDFLCNDFIHISVSNSTLSPIYNCSCKIFSVSSSNLDDAVVGFCLHVRLLKSLLSVLDSKPVLSDTHYIIVSVVNEGLKFSSISVIELPSRLNVNKFSVVANQSVAIVTVYKVSGSNRRVIQCHNSLCMINEGSKRALKYLTSDSEVCCHLIKFRECWDLSSISGNLNDDFGDYVLPMDGIELPDQKWIDVFDEVTGLWKFGLNNPSKQKVDQDPFSPQLVEQLNIRSRWIHNQSVYPFLDGICECGVGWMD